MMAKAVGCDYITIDGKIEESEDAVVAAMSMKDIIASEQDSNIFTIKAAKVGSKAFNRATKKKVIFAKEALEKFTETWNDGIITLNHNKLDNGHIIAAWFEDPFVMMTIQADNDETAERMRAGEATGVSIEARLLGTDEQDNITEFDGTGVSVIFYPDQPACPLDQGCGIVASDNSDSSDGDINMGDDKTYTQAEMDIVAKELTDAKATIASNEAGEVVKELNDTIAAKDIEIGKKDTQIKELSEDILARDMEIADKLVTEIVAHDPEFKLVDGMGLGTVEVIHASVMRTASKIEASVPEGEGEGGDDEDEDDIVASNFTAPPKATKKPAGNAVWGWQNVNGVLTYVE